MGPYFYKLKTEIIIGLTYRFEVFATLLARYVQIVATVFLWICVYQDRKSIHGMTREQMITWMILSAGLSGLYVLDVPSRISSGVRMGSIAVELIRPCSLPGLFCAQDIGQTVDSFFIKFIPIVLLGGITFGLLPPAGAVSFILALISVGIGYFILWLMYDLVWTLCFRTMVLGQFDAVLRTVIAIFSGSMIPLAFFPQPMQQILAWMPFQYTFQLPLGLYIGMISVREGLLQIGIQIIWLCILNMMTVIVWNRIRKYILIQGG